MEILKGKIIFFGSTIPGQDVHRLQGKEQFGIFGHLAIFEYLVNGKGGEDIRKSIKYNTISKNKLP